MTECYVNPYQPVQVYERLAAVPSIRYRPLQNSTDTKVVKSSSFDRSAGTTHDTCDVSKALAAMLYKAREQLDVPVAESTIDYMRQNAVASGLTPETQTEDHLPAEPVA